MNESMQELMLDLLCKKAEFGLSEQEEQQLALLQSSAGTGDLSTSFELTTATIAMADLDTTEEMPEHLRSRILADAEKYFAVNSTVTEPAPSGSIFNWLGWAVAAAACIRESGSPASASRAAASSSSGPQRQARAAVLGL